MMKKNLVYLMFVLLFGFQIAQAVAQVAAQQEEQRPSKAQVIELLTQAVRDAVELSLKLEDDHLLIEQQQFFELDQDAIDELKLLASRQLKKEMNQFEPNQLKRVLESNLANSGLGATYSVDGKEHTIEGYEPEVAFLTLSINTLNRDVSVRIKPSFGPSYQHLYRIRYPQPDFHLKWAGVVEANSDKSFPEYTKMVEDRYRENVLDAMLAVVGDSLAISPEQQDPIRNWLAQYVEVGQRQKLFRNAIKGLLKIEEVPDDLLTEDQRNAWQLMISELSLH